MKNTLTLPTKKIIDVYETCKKIKDLDLPIWWELSRNILSFEDVVTKYEKARKIIIERYVKKDEKGHFLLVEGKFYDFGENLEKADSLLAELLEESHTLDVWQCTKEDLNGHRLSVDVAISLIDVVLVE